MNRLKFPIISLFTKKNNTIITLIDLLGKVICSYSCGSAGFKKSKRSSSYAAEYTGFLLGKNAITKGIRYVQLSVRGIGLGRIASIRGIRASGLRISRIKDNSRIAYSGCRLKKMRRV